MSNLPRSRLKVQVVDTAIDPGLAFSKLSARQVRFQKQGDLELFKVWIYLDGPDVPFVKSVTYELHPSFAQRTHSVSRTPANPLCTLIIWTWGIFEVKATLRTKDDESIVLLHKLGYDREFAKEGISFVEEPV